MEERDADGDVEIKDYENVPRISEKYEAQLVRTKVKTRLILLKLSYNLSR